VWATAEAAGLCHSLRRRYIVEDVAVEQQRRRRQRQRQPVVPGGRLALMKPRSHHKAIDCLPHRLFGFDAATGTHQQ